MPFNIFNIFHTPNRQSIFRIDTRDFKMNTEMFLKRKFAIHNLFFSEDVG